MARPRRQAQRADLVVIGAGVAGLTAALTAAEHGLRVVILNKGPRWRDNRIEQPTSTFYAQGGVAVVEPGRTPRPGERPDSIGLHVADTLGAGAGLTDVDAAERIVGDGWPSVSALIAWGARFDRDAEGALLRTREGGHSVSRIIHAGGDATGAQIQRALADRAADVIADGSVACLDETVATELLIADGAVTGVAFRTPAGEPGTVLAPTVLLATGGAGQLYAATTNPAGATADGIALALRAGAVVADLEFIQFHPTMLHVPGGRGRRTLVSEAVRGEGGVLVDVDGGSVTAGVHPLGDLAPRDVVANAVIDAMRRTAAPYVLLDVRAVDDFERRFPTVSAGVRAAGLDPAAGVIPVVPGAHYLCGGVVTDTDGRTGVPGLLAAGEVARTGLHGGNRLASNSLLEGLVMGRRAAEVALHRAGASVDDGADTTAETAPAAVTAPALPRAELQDLMSRSVALRRDADGLTEVADLLAAAPGRDLHGRSDIEDASLTLTARAVVTAALARRESRGSHVRTDHPATDPLGRSAFFRLDGDIVVPVTPPRGRRPATPVSALGSAVGPAAGSATESVGDSGSARCAPVPAVPAVTQR